MKALIDILSIFMLHQSRNLQTTRLTIYSSCAIASVICAVAQYELNLKAKVIFKVRPISKVKTLFS